MVNQIFKKSRDILNYKNKSILSAAALIAGSYLASAFLGLIRNRLLAARFFGGSEGHLDVYFAAFVLPDTIFQLLVVGAVSAAFIPVYQKYLNKSEEEGNLLARSSMTAVSSALFLLTLIVFIFARPIAGLISHFPSEQLDLMANLIRIMSAAQLLFSLSAFLTGVLQAHRRFLVPALAPIFYNLGTILGILVLTPKFGIYSAAIGVVFGALLHVLVQAGPAMRQGFSLKPLFNFRHPGLKTIFHLMPPRTAALALVQVERWIAVDLTSVLIAGSLSIFNFARQLYVLPINLFGVSLGQASFPTLSDDVDQNRHSQFISTVSKSILQIFFFSLPASILILVLRIPIVRLVYGAKTFPWSATLLTGKVIALLALSIAPQAAAQLLTRAFHARQDTKTPLYINLFTLALFAFFSYLLTRYYDWGLLGLAFALTLTNLLNFVFLYIALRIQIGRLNILYPIIKMLSVSLFTGISLWLPMRLLDQFVFDTTRVVPLIGLTLIVCLVGFSVYLLFSYIFRVEELKDVISLIRKMGNWRQVLSNTDEVIEPQVSDQQ